MILIISALVAVAVAVPSGPGCCTPPQWEVLRSDVTLKVLRGLPMAFQETTKISYDETNNKIAYTVFEASRTPFVKIIEDYSKGQKYAINLIAKTCEQRPLQKTFQKKCLPADAKPIGTFYFGIGDSKLEAVSFSYYANGTNVTKVMTPDNCVPIFEVDVTANNKKILMQAIGFVNITPGIQNPDVFNIPDICKQRKSVGFDKAEKRTGIFPSFH